MGVIETAVNPWGQTVPIHIAFYLMWVAAIGGLAFLMVHAIYVQFVAAKAAHSAPISPALQAQYPPKIHRHSLASRLFHWVMSVAMFALLITAFLPRMGYPFAWVTYHWIAGLVLTASIIFHIFHATFWMDFWSIWPDKIDIEDSKRRWLRATGKEAPEPRKFAKYPHGLAGVGLIGLIMAHVYFALRPEKFVITKSMIGGDLDRDFYLEHYDQERWKVPAVK